MLWTLYSYYIPSQIFSYMAARREPGQGELYLYSLGSRRLEASIIEALTPLIVHHQTGRYWRSRLRSSLWAISLGVDSHQRSLSWRQDGWVSLPAGVFIPYDRYALIALLGAPDSLAAPSSPPTSTHDTSLQTPSVDSSPRTSARIIIDV